jgi:hypothetical protein
MSYMNPEEIKYAGIDKWHNAGYTGKGIKVAILDNPYTFPRPFIKDIFNVRCRADNSHGDKVMDILHEIIPDAEFIPIHNIDDACKRLGEYDYIKQNCQGINCSMSGDTGTDDIIIDFMNNGVFCTKAAGNDDTAGEDYTCKCDGWWTVGAVHLINGQLEIADYSAYGKGWLDMMAFSHLNTIFSSNKIDGTSFSAPFMQGMAMLYYQWYKEQYGKYPDVNTVREFFKTNAIDLKEKGYDLQSAYGLAILPDVPVVNVPIPEPIPEPEPKPEPENPVEEEEVMRGIIVMYSLADLPAAIRLHNKYHLPIIEMQFAGTDEKNAKVKIQVGGMNELFTSDAIRLAGEDRDKTDEKVTEFINSHASL